MGASFVTFIHAFSKFFTATPGGGCHYASLYINGLLSKLRRKNMERMEEHLPGIQYESMQYFLSEAGWDHAPLMAAITSSASADFDSGEDFWFILDETCMAKKGSASAGVARQWNGRLGKTENSQVAVFGALAQGTRCVPVGFRLYLPKEWTDDPARCEKAGIPESQRTFKTKAQLALELVLEARQRGARFRAVIVDGFYGQQTGLLRSLEDHGFEFLAEVHKDQRFTLSDRRLHPRSRVWRADEFAASLEASDWKEVEVRDSTRGALRVKAHARRVWIGGKGVRARRWWLLLWRRADGKLKQSLSNAPETTPLGVLVRESCLRFWIEHAFREAKSEAGMAQYQVRGWLAWHHHMALCCLALLFVHLQKKSLGKVAPLITAHDIVELLDHFLPKKKIDPEEVVKQMLERHRKRQAAIDGARRKRPMRQRHLRMNPTK